MERPHSTIFIDYYDPQIDEEYTICVMYLHSQRPPIEMILEYPKPL